jgi:hypothetical protein
LAPDTLPYHGKAGGNLSLHRFPLEIRDKIHVLHEMRNAETGEIAAT